MEWENKAVAQLYSLLHIVVSHNKRPFLTMSLFSEYDIALSAPPYCPINAPPTASRMRTIFHVCYRIGTNFAPNLERGIRYAANHS
jgi:hypothetical protein